MKQTKYHISIVLPGLVFGMLVYLYLAYQEDFGPEHRKGLELILAAACGILNAYAITWSSRWLDQKLKWQTQPGIRLISGLLLNGLMVFGITASLTWAYMGSLSGQENIPEQANQLFLKLGVILFLLMLLHSILYFALYSYAYYSHGQIEEIRQESKRIDLQLNALKSQLSPHFLFNSLNTVSNLVAKDVDVAEDFIRRLATLYQYTLKSYEATSVSLQEELEFVTAYLFLLQTRFNGLLDVQVDLPDQLMQSRVLPLSLQMLVENAVKHNELQAERPLHIQIGANDQWIWVRNNKTRTPQHINSFEIGLDNIRARYQLQYQKEIHIEDQDHFTVRLPIIHPS